MSANAVTVLRMLPRLFAYALAASLAASPLLLSAALLPVRPWATAYALCTLLVVALYGWWRAGCRRRDAERELWRAWVRNQELAEQRDDACRQVEAYRNASDSYLARLLDTGEI